MLLENVSITDLAEMLLPHMGEPAWPGLMDTKVRARAKRYADLAWGIRAKLTKVEKLWWKQL